MISISRRVFYVVLLNTLIVLVSALALAWWQVEALEDAMIESFASAEVEYFVHNGNKTKVYWTQSAQTIKVYIPHGEMHHKMPPILFNDLPHPFRGEVKRLDKVYAVDIHEFPEGTLYFSQDLNLFEETEYMALSLLSVVGGLLIVLSLLAARLAAQYISKPVLKLVSIIQKNQHLDSAAPIDAQQFDEQELQSICQAVNQFLEQRQAALTREKNWMAMASHEFRTPLSVIGGAVNVLKKRGQLSANDDITLNRISAACGDMTGYVTALLAIARRKPLESPVPIDLHSLIHTRINQLTDHNIEWPARIQLMMKTQPQPLGEATVVSIIIDNLLTNSLTHTTDNVVITVDTEYLTIADQSFLVVDQSLLAVDQNQIQGLGLYIVNQACEYLGWRFEVEHQGNQRHSIIRFNGDKL